MKAWHLLLLAVHLELTTNQTASIATGQFLKNHRLTPTNRRQS